jgi:hypothetical protein
MKTESQPIHLILSKVKHSRSGDGYSFKCPAHDDDRNSGYVKADEEGNAILKCFAGCIRKTICAALGISERDLYVESNESEPVYRRKSNFEILCIYPYKDAEGNLLFEKLRMRQFKSDDPKCLIRRTIEGVNLWGKYAGWFEKKQYKWERIKKANDPDKQPSPSARWFDTCPKVLFRLPEILSLPKDSLLLYVEGEKDVETAGRLGFNATTAGSATSWKSEFADDLAGFDLVIIPDNDDSGRNCAAAVARDCFGKAARIRVVELPGLPVKGDLSDWMGAGGTRDELLALIKAAKDYHFEQIRKQSTNALNDYQPIAADKDREDKLWLLPSSASQLLDGINLIFKSLGIPGDHTRLINALLMFGHKNGKYQRGTILAAHQWLADKYPADGGKSVDTVRRDIRSLRDAQRQVGVDILGYTKGDMNLQTGKGLASKFSRPFLRYALEAIYVAADNQNLILPDEIEKLTHNSLRDACEFIASTIPRTAPQDAKDSPSKQKTVEDLEVEFGKAQERLVKQMLNEGWSEEQIKTEFNRLQLNCDKWIERAVLEYQKQRKLSEPMVCNPAHHRDSEFEGAAIQ